MNDKFESWMHSVGVTKYEPQLVGVFEHIAKVLARRHTTKRKDGKRVLRGGAILHTQSYFGNAEPNGAFGANASGTQASCGSCAQGALYSHMPSAGRLTPTTLGGASKDGDAHARIFVRDALKDMKLSERMKTTLGVAIGERLQEMLKHARKGKKSVKVVDLIQV